VRTQGDAAPSLQSMKTSHDSEEAHCAKSSRNEASGTPTAIAPVVATRPGSVETPPAKDDLLLGVRTLVDSQSQIVNEIASKMVELKANVGKADSSNRQSLDEAKALYQRKLLEQQSNTTRLREINQHLEDDIQSLVSNNTKLRQKAHELKKQSLALRAQVTAAESNLTLAQEFVSKELLDDSNDDFQFLKDLRINESEVAAAQAHTFAVNHFGKKKLVAFLQLENDAEPVELIHNVGNKFSELSVQVEASKLALEQSFNQSFSHEAIVQESILAKHRALLDERQKQLALQSKLIDAVAHTERTKTYLSNRIAHLRSYALRLSSQY